MNTSNITTPLADEREMERLLRWVNGTRSPRKGAQDVFNGLYTALLDLRDRRRADVRLKQQRDDLLAALKLALPCIHHTADCNAAVMESSGPVCVCEFQRVVPIIRAAIAKTEGRGT